MRNNSNFSIFLMALMFFFLSGCAGDSVDMSKGAYKVGKPYVVNGKRYIPAVNYDYSETGLASWYGPGFHGKRTANGERFNKNELTAAHRTLPMPSLVRVTNLENGKSVVVRVNDRGPFSKNRVIDVSQRAAELLGFKNQGTAKVRVTILEQESRRIADAAMHGVQPQDMELQGKGMAADGPPPSYKTASTQPTGKPVYKLVTMNNTTVPGHLTNGNFYPDQVVTREKVKPTFLYVQAGSFKTNENAMALVSKLEPFGKAKISPVNHKGAQYYRVRLPAKNNQDAINLMSRISKAGYKNAQIVVE